MALKKITYFVDGKKKTVQAKVLKNPLEKALGLMFRSNPKPLFFTSNTFHYNPITSLFCKPFRAIWLDKNMKATKVVDVKTWKLNISGHGKYLLEIPLTTK
ncbi:hypothetical protein HNV12_02215 [Methanococcoides sp. SA1]|nr:hypothetical protein [Methanococcoides sp. SA1]